MAPVVRLGLATLLAAGVHADVYMQYPPGSNNRLDEGGGNRNNNNRLMDTQNNAKGGYGYGGDANGQAAPVNYMAGSQLSMAWTSQHSCGSENAECQILIQYMCNDGQTPAAGVLATTDPAAAIGARLPAVFPRRARQPLEARLLSTSGAAHTLTRTPPTSGLLLRSWRRPGPASRRHGQQRARS